MRWLRRVLAAIVSVLAGYGAAVCAMWLLQLGRSGHAEFVALFREYVVGRDGRFLLLLYLAFGLPHLVVHPGLRAGVPFRRAAEGGVAVGLSIAAGFTLLFVVLNGGSGRFWFTLGSLLFGAVAGLTAVSVFRLLGGPLPDARIAHAAEPSLIKRVAISAGALVISCGALCVLFSVGALIFDRYDSPTRWLPIYGFFVVFSVTGWFLFGLPILASGTAAATVQEAVRFGFGGRGVWRGAC